jgi:predicted small metal-binding protein
VDLRYCTLHHTEAAKLNGATDAEIENAVHFAKASSGWSTYINGLQIDCKQFKSETERAVDYIRSMQRAEKELRCRNVGADCDYVIHGKTEDEVFEKAAEHAKTVHHMKDIPRELMEKARAAIRNMA